MYKKLAILGVFVLTTFAMFGQQEPKAKAAFEKAVAIMKYSSVKMNFSTIIDMPTAKRKQTVTGTIWMKGAMFKLVMDGSVSYFDGKTEWVYQPDNNEVTIASVSGRDQQAMNPLAILSNYEGKAAKIIFDPNVRSTPATEVIDLFPANQAAAEFKIELRLNPQTHYPQSIIVFGRDGTHTYITIHSFQQLPALNNNTFVFDVKAYHGISVNDLR
ncbi:LolA family protein [Microbacter margulisiae]|uniref:Outer membrane lipoprotein-sorting protein n=1 Tax=Microbacter margulisiae TaxID=1350067 RepID=A0A7W5DQD8_9PORP|nr:outer membrane lipoprotein carrier protein LolA [Microbacter margulisiae]MBB3187076.1 outer membrane lipoprotein-sorting protein [Microbacter margulisiae]